MFKLFELTILILVVCDTRAAPDSNLAADESLKSGARQKKLLFYDEEGNLVKTYRNPYLRDAVQNAEKIPFFGTLINPFLNLFRPSTFGGPVAYMIPVSDEVIQHINSDPMYQNKLLTLPRKELVIAPSSLCEGKRSQIPADDCRNFLNCWDGWAFEQECPEGLVFAKEGYCDYPQNVDCEKRTNAPAPMAASPRCSEEYDAFRSEADCSEFFVCANRVPVKFKCPADLFYSENLGVCDYRDRVQCSNPPASDVATDVQAQPRPNPICSSNPELTLIPEGSAATRPAPETSAPVAPAADTNVLSRNTESNSDSWSSSHVAISRSDAIKQLQGRGGVTTAV